MGNQIFGSANKDFLGFLKEIRNDIIVLVIDVIAAILANEFDPLKLKTRYSGYEDPTYFVAYLVIVIFSFLALIYVIYWIKAWREQRGNTASPDDRGRTRKTVIGVIGIVLLVLICLWGGLIIINLVKNTLGFDNPSPITSNPTGIPPSPSSTITPTIQFTALPTPSGKQKFGELFDNNDFGWEVGEYNDTDVWGDKKIVNGVYRINAKFEGDGIAWSPIPFLPDKHFILTVDARIVDAAEGEDEACITLLFRIDDTHENYYYVLFCNNNTVSLRMVQDGNTSTVWEGTPENGFELEIGALENFRIDVTGSTFVAYVSGSRVFSLRDETLYHPGGIGIGVYGREGNTAMVKFEKVVVYEIP